MNLPFNSVSVIHSSNLMSESFVCCTSTATRQNAGKLSSGGPGKLPGLGGVNLPAASASASVIVVSGKARVARLSHVAALAERTPKANSAEKTNTEATNGFRDALMGVANVRALIHHTAVRNECSNISDAHESISEAIRCFRDALMGVANVRALIPHTSVRPECTRHSLTAACAWTL